MSTERFNEAEVRLLVNFHEESIRGVDRSSDFVTNAALATLSAFRSYDKGLELETDEVESLVEDGAQDRSDIVLATLRPYTVAQMANVVLRVGLRASVAIPNYSLRRDARAIAGYAISHQRSVI